MALINRKHCRDLLLNIAEEEGREQFTRVSDDVFRWLDKKVHEYCVDLVRRHPSIGKTLKVA